MKGEKEVDTFDLRFDADILCLTQWRFSGPTVDLSVANRAVRVNVVTSSTSM
jgi:hypothetical protein